MTQADALAQAARARDELERFFALSRDLLCVADFNGFFTRVNPAFGRALGHSSEELLREPFMSFVHPDDREATLAEFTSILQGEEAHAFENRYRNSDGSYRWLQWASATDRDAGLIYAVARDVTDAKHAAAKLEALLAEQGALRRVATLVAREGDPAELFAVVAAELGRLLGADAAGILRYESDEQGLIVGAWSRAGAPPVEPGAILKVDRETASGRVYRTGQPETGGPFRGTADSLAQRLGQLGYRSSLAAPIRVAGSVWGALGVATLGAEEFPGHSTGRLESFAELVAQALANADAREQLAASRNRVVQASDDERRRLERNLHDGAQQRLVTLSLTLRRARLLLAAEREDVCGLLDTACDDLEAALTDLRELAQGLHPAVLSDLGLSGALPGLTQRAPFPVEIVCVPAERLPESVEVAIYYLLAEALTNTAKHAKASSVMLGVSCDGDEAVVEVSDDGIGGADLTLGSGLHGLADRISALGGQIGIESAPGRGTSIRATIPVA